MALTNPGNTVRVHSRNGGRASVYEANMWAQKLSTGLFSGNGVLENTPSVNMNVKVGGTSANPDIVIASNPSGYKIALDLVSQQTILLAAPASNSRIACIVAYCDDLSINSVDNTTTGSQSSCGLIIVYGATSASPTAPSDANIRSAITTDGATGSQACYAILTSITLTSVTTTVTQSMINAGKTLAQVDGSVVLQDNSVSSNKVNWSVPNGKIWWEELGRTTLAVAGDSIDVTFTAKKYLRIIITYTATGGTGAENALRFNNDSGSNYAIRISTNGGADSTSVSANRIQLAGEFLYDLAGGQVDVVNVSSITKTIVGYRFGNFSGTPSSAGSAPDKAELVAKWANTSAQINRVTLVNTSGTGDYAIGSEIVILGHN